MKLNWQLCLKILEKIQMNCLFLWTNFKKIFNKILNNCKWFPKITKKCDEDLKAKILKFCMITKFYKNLKLFWKIVRRREYLTKVCNITKDFQSFKNIKNNFKFKIISRNFWKVYIFIYSNFEKFQQNTKFF